MITCVVHVVMAHAWVNRQANDGRKVKYSSCMRRAWYIPFPIFTFLVTHPPTPAFSQAAGYSRFWENTWVLTLLTSIARLGAGILFLPHKYVMSGLFSFELFFSDSRFTHRTLVAFKTSFIRTFLKPSSLYRTTDSSDSSSISRYI